MQDALIKSPIYYICGTLERRDDMAGTTSPFTNFLDVVQNASGEYCSQF